jgi:DNA-binding transcriptional MerR regulator
MSSALRRSISSSTTPANQSREDRLAPVRPPLIGIREMAERFDTTLRTLRFYEARGLISPLRDGMNRLYDAEAEQRFRLIDEGRKLGFTLTEIAELLATSRSANELRLTLDRILDQIEHLETQRKQLDESLAMLRKRYYLMREVEEPEAIEA